MPRYIKVIATIFVLLFISSVVLNIKLIEIIYSCSISSQIPKAPTFQPSTQIDRFQIGDLPAEYSFISYTYQTSASSQEVVKFYQDSGYCPDPLGRSICAGNSDPVGRFELFFENDGSEKVGVTHFTIEIRWNHPCSW